MVSEKVIVILIILAILVSVISIAITISTLNMDKIPEIKITQGRVVTDSDKGQVSLTIDKVPTKK